MPYQHYNQCCGSGMFIPDPGSEFFPSRIRIFPPTGSRIRIKEFKYFNQLFQSSRGKDDLGCSSRILILIFYPSRIQGSKRPWIQGSKRHRIPGSGSATLIITTCTMCIQPTGWKYSPWIPVRWAPQCIGSPPWWWGWGRCCCWSWPVLLTRTPAATQQQQY